MPSFVFPGCQNEQTWWLKVTRLPMQPYAKLRCQQEGVLLKHLRRDQLCPLSGLSGPHGVRLVTASLCPVSITCSSVPPPASLSLPTDTALDLEQLPAPHSSAWAPQSNDIAKTLFPRKIYGHKFCFVRVHVCTSSGMCRNRYVLMCVEIGGQL